MHTERQIVIRVQQYLEESCGVNLQENTAKIDNEKQVNEEEGKEGIHYLMKLLNRGHAIIC